MISGKMTLEEDFKGVNFISEHQIANDDRFIKIDLEIVNANAAAIFMAAFVGISATIAFFAGSRETALVILVGGVLAGGMLIAALYAVAAQQQNQRLPYVDKEARQLVLPSGTIVKDSDIVGFQQYQVYTKMSNFRLVLTTVVTSKGLEYAVCPVQGKLSNDQVGAAFAEFFGVLLRQEDGKKIPNEELTKIGVT